MKLRTLFFVSLFLSVVTVMGQGVADKKAAEVKKLEASLKTAQTKVDAIEKKNAVADSLVETGTTLMAEAKSEIKAAAQQRKALDKEYATNRKPLNKLLGSKDKAVATQAKADLKALDTQYKADVKALDAQAKAATKKMTTGEANVTKGKTARKSNDASMKTAAAALDAAQAKYDAATGVEPPAKGKKKKK